MDTMKPTVKHMSDHQDSDHFTYHHSWEEIEDMLDKAERLPSGVEYQLSAINIPQSFKDLKSPAPVDIAVVATYASGL